MNMQVSRVLGSPQWQLCQESWHLGDVTAQAVTKSGLSTVGLLGTAFTMEQDFYRDRLASHVLTVLIPPPAERAGAPHHLQRAVPHRGAE